jgi:hypothetical protein
VINDHSVKGKCYGFVTFTHPRAAENAIAGMDGKVCFLPVWNFITFLLSRI